MGDLNFLHTTTDAAIWAREFCRLFPMGFSAVEGQEGAVTQDNWEGLMIGWFANAIETGRDNPRPAPDVVALVGQARLLIDTGFSRFGETVDYSPKVTEKVLDLLDAALTRLKGGA